MVHIELFANETSALPITCCRRQAASKGRDRPSMMTAASWIDKMIDPPGERNRMRIWIELGKRFGFDDVLKDK
jgi:hypothetical protein